jgi:catechol 2,3-dioxygenase-like lactoylglutathione lyase family enzyme
MTQSIGQVAIVVRDCDEALEFYVGILGFNLIEDTPIRTQSKRWVVVAPPGGNSSRLLLARAVNDEQLSRIGNQTGGRVFLFLYTDDFWRDYSRIQVKGIAFVREPKEEEYGTVAVFKDLYGNLWDLVELRAPEVDGGYARPNTGDTSNSTPRSSLLENSGTRESNT